MAMNEVLSRNWWISVPIVSIRDIFVPVHLANGIFCLGRDGLVEIK